MSMVKCPLCGETVNNTYYEAHMAERHPEKGVLVKISEVKKGEPVKYLDDEPDDAA